jgi:chaperonin GroES
MKINPLQDYVLIEPLEEEKKSKGGIVLPETAEKEPQQGKIIAVGPGKRLSSGKIVEPEVKKGDVVLFRKYGPDEIKVGDKKYLIAKAEDVLAIIG